MAGLVEKWNNWRDLSKRKSALTKAIASRNPETVKAAIANLKVEEVTADEKSGWLRDAIDQQSAECFKEVLTFVDNPNLDIAVDLGGRYSDIHHYSPLCYALTRARTHDISKILAGDPRVAVCDDDMESAKAGGMADVAAVLAGRVADLRRHEADLRLQEAAHLDKEAAAPKTGPAAMPEAAPASKPDADGETWALMSKTSVAHVTSSALINRKLTEIFNFDDGERRVITSDMKGEGTTIAPPEKFESLNAATLKRAEEKLKELNASSDAAAAKRTFNL